MSLRPRKTYRPYQPEQQFLLPPSLRDWLPEGHLAFFVSDVVDELDLSPIRAKYEVEGRGYPPYDPRLMVKLLIYGYCVGVTSSRKIAKRLHEDVAFRFLAANNWPDFRTIGDFRKRHLAELGGLFDQVLLLCQKAGLVKLGHVAVDGTKIEANASKHKAMSYGRMKKEEQRLSEQVKKLLDEAERVDAEEDARFGKDKTGDELPEELSRHASRRQKIREAKAALEAEAKERDRERLEDEKKRREEGKPLPRRLHPLGIPRESEQRNFTDPDSRIMVSGQKAFVQAYNAQVAVDATAQVIVAADLTNVSSDQGYAVKMVEHVIEAVGCPRVVTMDAGYFSARAAEQLAARGVEGYIAVGRTRRGSEPESSPRGRIPKNASPRERMERRLQTKRGRALYALRKSIVEPVLGQIKSARGIRRFLLRGAKKVHAEWRLICATHNLLKLHRAALV